MSASRPPFMKYCWTANVIGASSHSPPYRRSNSVKLVTSRGASVGPRDARPMKAAVDVGTPSIGRTPPEISSMYTPGYVGISGNVSVPSRSAEDALHLVEPGHECVDVGLGRVDVEARARRCRQLEPLVE